MPPSRKIARPSGWRAGNGAAPPQIGPRRRWQPGDDAGGPRRAGRWVKIAAVMAGLLAAAGGLGYLLILPTPPAPPLLVVVGADPARDALRLDVPPDPAGWQTGRRLIALGRAAAAQSTLAATVVSAGDLPDRLPADPAGLDAWVGKLAGDRSASEGRVLIYLGLHAGVGPDGRPVLWTGGGDRLPVGDLLAKLADTLARRSVVVLLDPHRLPPDPLAGHLANDVAGRLAKDEQVTAALAAAPRMVLVCGCGDAPGEVGWESEELQATAFGHAVLRGLRGEAPSAQDAVTVRELFEFVRDATADWTAGNRPARQTPILLPGGQAGLDRAGGLIAGYRLPPPPDQPPGPAGPLDRVAALWERHDRLDGDPLLPPASYAPQAWRRGRELLLRFQQAARLGEPRSAGELEKAVGREFDRVEAAAAFARTVVDKAKGTSIPLAETFGDTRAAAAEAVLRAADAPGGVALLPFDRLGRPGDDRPAEALLAAMAHHFHTAVAPSPLPAGWAGAFAARRAAERAAAGGPAPGEPATFAERAWPAVRDAVTAADARRREAEDRLFATAPGKPAADALDAAATGYRAASGLGAAVRHGSRVRDRAFADLPFLARWAAAAGKADGCQLAVTAWADAHALADALDRPGPGLADAASAAERSLAAARRPFDTAAASLAGKPESQDRWLEHERLLAGPLVPAAQRAAAVSASRAKTAEWAAKPVPAAGGDPGNRAAGAKEAARWHARLAALALGDRHLDELHKADDLLPDAAGVRRQLADLAAAKGDWGDRAAKLGDDLRRLNARAGADPAPKEYPAPDAVAAAERRSRSAAPPAEADGPEPARVAAALRWQALLAGLADRAARDHWYDEQQEPYWRRAANALLADARRAVPADGFPRVAGAAAVPADYADAPRLAVRPAPGTPDPLPWTSQRQKAVTFQAAVPADFPPAVTGLAVGWRPPPAGPLRWADAADRRPLAVKAGAGGTLAGTLALADGAAEDLAETVPATAELFFRGQRKAGQVAVRLARSPDRVIREPLPARTTATVAVRAEPDVPLGQVAVLLDYSGSMRADALDGEVRVPGWEGRDTRFSRAQAALRQVLADLPAGTPLRVRVFSDRGDPQERSRRVFPDELGGRPEVTWRSAEDARYLQLTGRLGSLKPEGFTPLLRSITTAVDDDFDWDGPAGGLAKTLVVLTDGVDERDGDGTGAARRARIEQRIRQELAGDLRRLFDGRRGREVGLFVVPFGQSKDDAALCQQLFAGVRRFPTPGRLFGPTDGAGELRDTLLEAIYPKLKLLDAGRAQPPGMPESGLPGRVDRSRVPPYSRANGGTDLLWSPAVPAGGYTAQPNPSLRPGPPLTLDPGEAVVLGFARDGRGGVRVRRELHADYFAQADAVRGRRADGGWSLASPWPVRVPRGLEAVVFVERVPPHRRTPPGEPQEALAADPPDPTGTGREVVWFDLLTADGTRPPGRLTVTRQHGHPAPAWKLEQEGWAADPRAAVRVRAVAAGPEDGLPRPHELRVPVPEPGAEAVLRERAFPTEDDLEVRAAVEDRSPDGGQPAPAGAAVLVLRVTHPAGRPVLARLADPRLGRAAAAHRYYPPADGRGEYTAAFTLPRAELARAGRVRVNLAAAGWAAADDARDRLAVTLAPAVPHTDRAGEPKPVEPGRPAGGP